MIADAATQIVGDLADVSVLMGPGVDPHLYQPTARDQGRLKSAQLILYNGLHLEGKMADLFESLAKQKHVVAVSCDIPDEKLLAWRDSAGMHDPHIWFDVELWQIVVKTITNACSQADPSHIAEYEQRATAYLKELEDLDRECRDLVKMLPVDQRILITSHDAFHYFGRAYGFEVVGIQGISTDSEAGLKAITDAVDLIRSRKIRAIFPETSVPHAAIERVATDGQARLGPELYSDSLGAPDSPAGTYVGMIRTNMKNIVESLREPTPQK
jgi:manganese/zinc/iron transport system substrate-binding protein